MDLTGVTIFSAKNAHVQAPPPDVRQDNDSTHWVLSRQTMLLTQRWWGASRCPRSVNRLVCGKKTPRIQHLNFVTNKEELT